MDKALKDIMFMQEYGKLPETWEDKVKANKLIKEYIDEKYGGDEELYNSVKHNEDDTPPTIKLGWGV